MKTEEQLLAASIRSNFEQADRALVQYARLTEANTVENVRDGDHAEKLDEAEAHLNFLAQKAFRDTGMLAERLGLPQTRGDLMAEMRGFKSLTEIEMISWLGEFHSYPLSVARSYFGSMAQMVEGREVTSLSVFETILDNTAKIIKDANVLPKSEHDVQQEIRRTLKYAFRDVVEHIPLSKNLKTYKPDIGVRSLMAAAEYKFVNTGAKAKSVLDGIYADMRGYHGHPEWRSFYAVIYMTEPFYSQKDAEVEFELVKADMNWKPIVVHAS